MELLLVACSGSGTTATLPVVGRPAYQITTSITTSGKRPKSKIKLTPSHLDLVGIGKANAGTVVVSEKRYKGTFKESSTCKRIASAAPRSGKGPSLHVTITPLRVGSCAIAFSDAHKNTAKLHVTVTSGTASPSPTPSSSLVPSPTASPAVVYVTYSTSSCCGTMAGFDEQGNLQSLSGTWSNAGEPFGIAYDAHNGLLYATTINQAVQFNAYDAQGQLQTLNPGFSAVGNVLSFAFDSSANRFYLLHQTPPGCTSTCTNAVSAYDENGNPVTLSGSWPSFTFPGANGMAFDAHNGVIYVANNSEISAYDEQGNAHAVSGSFGAPAMCTPNFPQAIAFDSLNDSVYVAWDGNGCGTIAAYDEDGNTLTLAGSFANTDYPAGIAVDSHNGMLYVVNSTTVTVYNAQGVQQSTTGSFNPGFSFQSTNGVAIIPPQGGSAVRKRSSKPRLPRVFRPER